MRALFEPSERLVVRTTLQVVRELGVDWWGELLLELLDAARSGLQTLQVRGWVPSVVLSIGDGGKTLAQGGCEIREHGFGRHKRACSGLNARQRRKDDESPSSNEKEVRIIACWRLATGVALTPPAIGAQPRSSPRAALHECHAGADSPR